VNPRFAATVLFLAAFVALPLPLFGLDGVVVPAARFVQLTGAIALLIALEGTGGMVLTFAALLGAHALVYTGVLAAVAWMLGSRVLPKIPHRLRDHVTVICTTLLLALGVYADLYDTRFHHASAHAKLLELYR
jgi:hypothetical protein